MDQATILAAALTLLDEEGLERLTMRRLGEQLGMSAMATYRYFPSKDAVLDALVDELVARWQLPADELHPDPHERVLAGPRRMRSGLLEHPALAQVVVSRPLRRGHGLDDLAVVVDRLAEAGFPRDAIALVAMSLAGFTLGFAAWECRTAHDRADREPSYVEDRERLLAMAEAADPGAPITGIMRLATAPDGDEVFELGLTALYAGLRQRYGVADDAPPT